MKTDFVVSTRTGEVSGLVGKAELDGKKKDNIIVAVHGGTYSSKYFDVLGYSLVDRAISAGFDIIAIDRPGYGKTTALGNHADMLHQNALRIVDFIPEVADKLGLTLNGAVLIGHSMGGVISTTIAALAPNWPVKAIINSGFAQFLPSHLRDGFASLPDDYFVELPTPMKDQLMFGPAGTLSNDMPMASHIANTRIPKAELIDIGTGWADRLAELAPRVEVPVFHKLAEHEQLWDISHLEAFSKLFVRAPRMVSGIVKDAGHCIDFHRVGAMFQAEQLEFAAAAEASDV
ncbi:MAG: alpha/beta hydrolase [Rhizobiaceae bacterium]